MHRQADDIVGEAFACRQTALGDRETPVVMLLMHRLWIIDRGRNALCLQLGGEAVAIAALGQPDGVLRPDRGAVTGKTRNRYDIAKTSGVTLRDPVARGNLVLEDFQFLDQDRRLHGVEPPGEPETNIIVFVRALAVNAAA